MNDHIPSGLRETVEKILSPALDVRAPYAKIMIDAVLAEFDKAISETDHCYIVSAGAGIVVLEHGQISSSFDAEKARELGNLLIEAANLVDNGHTSAH